MQRRFSVVLISLIFLAMFTTTAFAASANDNKSVTMVSVEYQEGGMVMFFHTSGLTKNDLANNSFYAHSNYYNMYCNFIGNTTDVRCSVSKKLAAFEGESFHVILAGFGFYDVLPVNTYCSSGKAPWVYANVYENGQFLISGTIPLRIWNWAVTSGYFDYLSQTYGYTYTVTGSFCSSQYYGPV